MGFRIGDVKLIVNSHEHFDHAGGIAALQRASGVQFFGLDIHIDFASLVLDQLRITNGGPVTYALPIPLDSSLRGVAVRGQVLLQELATAAAAASPGIEITVL